MKLVTDKFKSGGLHEEHVVEHNVPKRRHIKFRHRVITQKKAYSITRVIFDSYFTILFSVSVYF